MEDERLPSPVVTDLDSDGYMDLVYITPEFVLVRDMFSQYSPSPGQPLSNIHIKQNEVNIFELSDGGTPVAMATGYLRQYQSMIQVRQQVIVVLLSDWQVLCLSPDLKLLWKSQPLEKTKNQNLVIREASVLISHVSIRKGDTGCVVVGGRVSGRPGPHDSFTRARRGGKIGSEEEMLGSFEHYTTVALDGASGEVRWQHTPSDFQLNPVYRPDVSSFHHLKLYLHKQLLHEGEVSWHQYSHSLNQILPHTWLRDEDTHFQLAHFKKDRRKRDEPDISEHILKVGGLAADHIAGLAFGGLRPHSADEHVQDPNVLVVHSAEGVSVLHLYQGRPLCSIPLSSYHTTHADVNGDGTIDHVQAVVNPMEDDEDELGCYGYAVPMVVGARPLFKHSICKATHWSETFIATDKWFPLLNKVGRKNVDHDITEPLPPVLLESIYHSSPVKLHLGVTGYSWTRWLARRGKKDAPPAPPLHPEGPVFDSVFVLSSGRVTSIGPKGEFNWQVDSRADWDSASAVIYNSDHPTWNEDPHNLLFLHGTFTPSATGFSLHSYDKKDHILILGWRGMVVLSGRDGALVAFTKLPCQPIAPPIVADFSDDGWNDVIVTCSDRYEGYVLSRQSGFWNTTVLSLFLGVVLTIIAIYTRQRKVRPLPLATKPSQD